MSEARPRQQFDAVRSGLQLLVIVAGINAGLIAVNRAVTEYMWTAPGLWGTPSFSVFKAISTVLQLAFIGSGIAGAIGALRLADLPPSKRVEKSRSLYRDAPVTTLAPAERGLARAVLAFFVADVALNAAETIGYRLVDLSGTGRNPFMEALWIASTLASLGAIATLVAWVMRVARAFDVRLGDALPISLITIVVLEDGFMMIRYFTNLRLPPWTSWLFAAVAIGVQVGILVLLGSLRRGLATLPADDAARSAEEVTRGPSAEAALRWVTASSGLDLYASWLKTKIGISLGGGTLIVVLAASRAIEGVQMILVLMQVISLTITIAMVVALTRWSRVPSESDAGDGARIAIVLLCLGGVVDLYGFKLVLDLLSDSFSTKLDAMAVMPWIEVGSQAIGGVAILSFLGSLRRAASFIGARDVAEKARSLMLLLIFAVLGAMALKASMTEIAKLGAVVFLLVPVLLVVGIMALVRYFAVLRELRSAIVSWTEQGDGEDGAGAMFGSHLR